MLWLLVFFLKRKELSHWCDTSLHLVLLLQLVSFILDWKAFRGLGNGTPNIHETRDHSLHYLYISALSEMSHDCGTRSWDDSIRIMFRHAFLCHDMLSRHSLMNYNLFGDPECSSSATSGSNFLLNLWNILPVCSLNQRFSKWEAS